MSRVPVRVPAEITDLTDPYLQNFNEEKPDDILLPPPAVIEAGLRKFLEMAALHWPHQQGGFKLTSFDIRNDRQLRMTLGLAYMAMKEEENK
jgi:hypothetical protein